MGDYVMKTAKQYYTAIRRLKKKADSLFQEVGLKLEPNCVVCSKKATLRHHVIAKSLSSGLRHDILNGVSMCWSCHTRFHATGDMMIYEKIISSMTAKQIEHIKANRNKVIKPSKENYLLAIKQLEIYGKMEIQRGVPSTKKKNR